MTTGNGPLEDEDTDIEITRLTARVSLLEEFAKSLRKRDNELVVMVSDLHESRRLTGDAIGELSRLIEGLRLKIDQLGAGINDLRRRKKA